MKKLFLFLLMLALAVSAFAFTASAAVTYNVYYVLDSGEELASDTSYIPENLKAATKEGFEFFGWYTDSAFQNEAIPGAPVTEETRLYPCFKETGTVSYEAEIKNNFGNRKFETLETAFATANKMTTKVTIKLTADVDLSKALEVSQTAEIVLDLNGKTVTMGSNVNNYSYTMFKIIGNATFLDSYGGGTIHNQAGEGGSIFTLRDNDDATLTIVSGSYLADQGSDTMQKLFDVYANGTITINGGKFLYRRACFQLNNGAMPTVSVNGGTFTKLAGYTGADRFVLISGSGNPSNIQINAAITYFAPVEDTGSGNYGSGWFSKKAATSSYTEITDKDGVTCYRIAPPNTAGTLYLKDGNVYADEVCNTITYYPGITSYDGKYYLDNLTMEREGTCLVFCDLQAKIYVLGDCSVTSTNTEAGRGTVEGYSLDLDGGNGTWKIINATEGSDNYYAYQGGTDAYVFSPAKLYMTSKTKVVNTEVYAEDRCYFYSESYLTESDALTMGTVDENTVLFKPGHKTMLVGDPIPVFDDRFGGTVTTGNYNDFTSTTNSYVASKGYVFQGWYTGIDGRGTKLDATATPVGGTTYYAFYKTTDGRPVVTTPLDFSDTDVQDAYETKTNGIQWISSVSADTQDTLILDNVVIDVVGNSDIPALFVTGDCTIRIVGNVEIILRKSEVQGVSSEPIKGLYHLGSNSTLTLKGADENAKLTVTMGDNVYNKLYGVYAYCLFIDNLVLNVKTGKLTAEYEDQYIINAAVYTSDLLETSGKTTLNLVAGDLENAYPESYSVAIDNYYGVVYLTDVNAYLSGKTGALYRLNVHYSGVDVYGSSEYEATNVKGEIVYINRYGEEENEIRQEYRLRGGAPVKSLKTVVHYEAAIGETKYTTLAAAIEAAAKGDTVKLLRDVVLTDEGLTIREDDEIILDLNGHVLALSQRMISLPMTASAPGLVGKSYNLSIFENNGKLTVKDTGDQNQVHYIAIGSNNFVWLLTEGVEGFDAQALTYADPYGNMYKKDGDAIAVSKICGGILGPCGSEAITNYGTLVLESGTIARCGGGVNNGNYMYYDDDTVVPTFTMNGGVITECQEMGGYTIAFSNAYGSVSNAGVFIMNGGTIEGNELFGVVNEPHYNRATTSGIFKMYGGKIENNVGGVLMNEGSQIVLGNTVSIKNNKNEQGALCNLTLSSGITVSFDSEKPLAANSIVGVTVATAPTKTDAVPVTVANTTDYTKTFVSDYDGYLVKAEENKTVLTLWMITGQPTKDTDYSVTTNDNNGVTYQWHKVLPDKVYGDGDVVTETPAEGDWKDAGKLLFLDSYDGTVEGNVFTSYFSQYNNYLDLLFNKNLVKVGDVFYFTSKTALKISTWGEEPAKLESLDNNQYRLTILMLDEVISLVPTDSSLAEAFTISNLLVHQSQALTGETKAKLGTVSEAGEYFCRVTRGNATLDSETVTAVTVSFAGGEDATGTAPNDLFGLPGRKVTLPANTYTKTGYKFDKWETYTAGSDYTVGDSDVTLTAAWTEKATLTVDMTAQESEIGASLSPYTVKCTETSTGFTVSYRKYTTSPWTTVAPTEIGVYQVLIERDEDDTYKAVYSDAGSYSVYYVLTFSENGATSGSAPEPVKGTIALADFTPETSGLLSANTLAKEGFVQNGWLVEKDGKLVKWESQTTGVSVLFYPCWKPVVNTLDKSNDFGVTNSGTDISYQWYAYNGVAFENIDSEKYSFIFGTYDAQTKKITSVDEEGTQIIMFLLDPEFASAASYLSCKLSCDVENDYYDYDSNYLNPNASQLYCVNVVDIDGELYLYICSFAPFTASDLTLYVPTALSGETKNKTEKISGADLACEVSYVNRVGEMTFVTSTFSNVVTPVKISFVGGEDVSGTAPADMYQLEGRKITLPANPFTKAGEAFCGWAFDDAKHAAGTAFTALGEDVTLTATFKPEIVLESKTYEYKFDQTAHAYTLAGRDAALSDFVISYLVNGTWTENAPVAAGKYDVKITRAESEDFGPIDLLVEGGVVIKAVEMSSKVDEDTKKSDVIVSTEEGFPADVTVVVEVTVESSVESKIKDNELVDYYSISDEAVKLGKHEEVALVFDVKLIRTVNGVETEIQPEDIAPGTKIKVKMLIPAELDTSKITRILHVHTAGDIEEIPFDASKVDENGYYEIEINRLSEFAFICETDCQLHWFMLGASVLFVALIAVLYLVCGKRKHDLFTILSCVVYGIVEAILFIFSANCSFCLIMLIVAVVLLLLAVLLFLANDLFKKKDEKAEPKGEEPKAAEASAEPLSLHDAIEQVNAASVTNLQITKASIAEFLQKKFGENVEVNCRANYISSGILPLADTHYKKIDGGKKCFIYVYELSGGQVFCLVRANASVASQIQKKHPAFVRSAYPKTKEQDWYTLLLDDTFASAADVFDTLTFVFENFSVTKKVLLTKPETQKDEKTGSV